MIFNLDELDIANNLEDERPGITYFEPTTPQYKKLKYGNIVSLTLRITNQNNNIMNYGPGTTVVLHIRNFFLSYFKMEYGKAKPRTIIANC